MNPVPQPRAPSNKAGDDDLVMNLVEMALARDAQDRQAFIESVCEDDSAVLERVRGYVAWEERMQGFMRSPLIPSFLEPQAEERPFAPGETLLGRFAIIREIARGGMGIVYEALDNKLDRRVALKCPKAKYRRRLPPEVRIASDLTHANICKTYDIHEANGVEFLTMEYLEGETLSDRLKRKPLAEDEIRDIARQLAAGLGAAHRAGVVHGDLKTNNVILTRTGEGTLRAVITDFGLARNSLRAPSTGDDAAGGTPAYMAPELWKGSKGSPASDVYALGVILYETVSGGRRPFESRGTHGTPGSSRTRTMADVSHPGLSWQDRLHRKPAPLNSKWDALLERCLHPEPARRYQSAMEVERVLAPSKTRQRLLLGVAASVLAALTGLITYERATAPAEQVVLAVLPFESDPDLNSTAVAVQQELTGYASQLQGSKKRSFRTITKAGVGGQATHTFRAELHHAGPKIEFHARLVDVRPGGLTKDWSANYSPGELRYAPVALAGMMTGVLELPPLRAVSSVNAFARSDYESGLQDLRTLSGVDAALPKLARSVAADPDSALTYAALAEAQWFKYFATKDKVWLENFKESVRQAELRDPDAPAVHRVSGILLDSQGFYTSAQSQYLRAIEINPDDSDAHRRLAQSYSSDNQDSKAEPELQKAIQADHTNYRNYQALGALYYGQSRYADAAVQMRKALEFAPHETSLNFALATMFELQGKFKDAESQFREILKLEESANALEGLGYDLIYQSRDQEAIPYLVRATEVRAGRARTWIKLGIAYRHLGRLAESKSANTRGRELAEAEVARDPRYAYGRAWLGYAQVLLGDLHNAEANIAQALQVAPEDQEALVVAAMAYAAIDHREQALGVLTRATPEALANFNRFPDFPGLKHEARFQQLLVSKQIK